MEITGRRILPNFFESMATAVHKSQLDKLDEFHTWLPLPFDFG